MAANPSISDNRSMRAGTGIGIALAIAGTVGAIAFLAPRLTEEMRDDPFSRVGANAPARPVAMAAAPASPAPPVVATPPAPQPIALKPSTRIVPEGSLGPGESEIAAVTSARAPQVPRTHRHPAQGAQRKKAYEPSKLARARAPSVRPQAPRLVLDDTVNGRPLRPNLPAARARIAETRRETRGSDRLIGGIRREDPFDYRTWRMHRNPDAPSSSPVERQPG